MPSQELLSSYLVSAAYRSLPFMPKRNLMIELTNPSFSESSVLTSDIDVALP